MKPALGTTLSGMPVGCANRTGVTAAPGPDRTTGATPPIESTAMDTLPPERGFVVDAATPCAQASNATFKLHHASGFGAARENCDFDRIVRTAPDTYTVTQTCTDIQSGSTEPSTGVLEIKGPNAFSGDNRNCDWKHSARHRPQPELPGPWRATTSAT